MKKNNKPSLNHPPWSIVFVILTLLSLGVSSCKPKQILVNHTEYVDRVKYDSIYTYKNDSIYIHQKGDTVLIEKFKTFYRDKLVIRKDSFIKVDSITVPVYVEKIKRVAVHGFVWWTGLLTFFALTAFAGFKLVTKTPIVGVFKKLLKII